MKRDMANRISEKLRNDAAQWHARVSNETASEADWLAFTDWLEQDDAHREAYDSLEDMLIELEEFEDIKAAQVPIAPVNTNAVNTNAVNTNAVNTNNVIDAGSRWGGMRQWATAAVAIAATIIIVIGVRLYPNPDYGQQEYATAIGEQRLITLTDGSMVKLNTNSRLKVMFERNVRKTELTYGQALFTITKDSERPFLVNVGDSHVQVVGTVFDILRHDDNVRVTVARGVVEVAPIKTVSSREIVRLLPGTQITHKEGAADITDVNVTKVDPMVVTAWQSGYLEYDDARLVDVVNDLNRYFPTPMRVEGLARDLRFSGVIRTADEDGALQILSEGLSVNIEHRAHEILILPKAN